MRPAWKWLLAAAWCVAASAQAETGLDQGITAFEKRDFERAFQALRPLAEEGNARAQLYMARIFEQEKAPAEALEQGGPYRYSRPAIQWYRRAADNGNAVAMNDLAVHVGRGWKHLDPDPQRAAKLLHRASEAGHGKASFNLYALERNQGNEDQAQELLLRAAEQGMPKAQNRLGMLYATGREGMSQDFSEAEKWLARAAEQGHKPAQATLPTVKRQLGKAGDQGEGAEGREQE